MLAHPLPAYMDREINQICENYLIKMKDDIRNQTIELDIFQDPKVGDLMRYIYDYPRLVINKDDIIKKRHVAPGINPAVRCISICANGNQCNRRRKDGTQYCGTHYATRLTEGPIEDDTGEREVVLKSHDGIYNFVDKDGHSYMHEDIIRNAEFPRRLSATTGTPVDSV